MWSQTVTWIIYNNFCFILFHHFLIIIFFGVTKNGRQNRSSDRDRPNIQYIYMYSFYIANLVFGPDTIRSAPFAWFMLVIFYYSFPWDGKIFLQAWGSAISPSTTKRIIEPQTHGTQEDFKTNKFVICKITIFQISPRSQLNTSRPSKSVHISWMWHYIPYLSIPLYTINWCKRFSRVSACIQHFYF